MKILRNTIVLTLMLVNSPLHLSRAADTQSQNPISIDELLEKSKTVEEEKFDAEVYEEMAKGLDSESYFFQHAETVRDIARLCTNIRENRKKMENFEKGGILDMKDFMTTQQQLVEWPGMLQNKLIEVTNIRTNLPEKYETLMAAYPAIERKIFEGILTKEDSSFLFLAAIDIEYQLLWEHRWRQQDFQKELLENINQRKGEGLNKDLLVCIETENKLMDCRLGNMGHLMSLYAFVKKEKHHDIRDETKKAVLDVTTHFREFQRIHKEIETYPNKGFPNSLDQSNKPSSLDIKRELEGKGRQMHSDVCTRIKDKSKISEICPGMTNLPVFLRGLQDIFNKKKPYQSDRFYFWMNNFLPYDRSRGYHRILVVNDKGVFLDSTDSRQYR